MYGNSRCRRLFSLNRGALVAIPLFTFGLSGCWYFYEKTTWTKPTMWVQTKLAFDSTFPLAMEELFDTCHDPLILAEGSTIPPLGKCGGLSDLPTERSVALGSLIQSLASMSTGIQYPDGLEEALQDEFFRLDDLSWPLQNCKYIVDLDMSVHGLWLTDLDADWTTRDGKAALHVDFDPQGTPLISGYVMGTASCPSSVSEWIVEHYAPDGPLAYVAIGLEGVDLDIYVTIEPDGLGGLTVDIEAEFSATGYDVLTHSYMTDFLVKHAGDIDEYLDENTVEGFIGMTPGELADDITDQLQASLWPLAFVIESQLEAQIPSGHKVWSVWIDAGELVILSGKTLSRPGDVPFASPPSGVR